MQILKNVIKSNKFQLNKVEGILKNKDEYPLYPNALNGITFYSDIIKYLESKYSNIINNNLFCEKRWPEYILKSNDRSEKDNLKRIFRIKASKYFYFNKNLYINKNNDMDKLNDHIFNYILYFIKIMCYY